MKGKPVPVWPPYQRALHKYLKQRGDGALQRAQVLSVRARAAGLHTLDLARLHERVLLTEVLPACTPGNRARIIKRASNFFAAAITPLGGLPPSEGAVEMERLVTALSRRAVEVAVANSKLRYEILQRKAVEEKLKKSERHYSLLLRQSAGLQMQLRRLSRHILSAQEEERKKISRDLHDVIAQTLTGINVRLAHLKRNASRTTKGLDRSIALTQRLVEQSVNIVHQFARELRPAVLDDLGLIPALHSFMKSFSARTGVRTRLTAFAAVEQLDAGRRTVLFRVAQEALTNVALHARASEAKVNIQKLDRFISMTVEDNGKGFLRGKKSQRLGLLGMRERVEMVHGTFSIESAPGKGTAVKVLLPLLKRKQDTAAPGNSGSAMTT